MKTNRSSRFFAILLFVILVAIGIGVFGFLVMSKEGPQKQPIQQAEQLVRVIPAPKTEVVPVVRGYGTVEPTVVWQAIAEVRGDIVEINPRLEAGEIILEPTTLLKIDPTEYRLAVQQLQAQLNQNQAQLKELETNLQNLENLLEIEKEILQLAQRDLERKQALLEQNNISPSTYEEQEQKAAAQRAKVQQLENQINLIPDQRDTLQAQIAVTRSKLDKAQVDLQKTEVKLPFPARIANVPIENNIFVAAGTLLVEAHNLDAVEITAEIQPAFMQKMLDGLEFTRPDFQKQFEMTKWLEKFGFSARVYMNFGDWRVTWDAEVVRIRGTMNPKTRTIGVIVRVEDPYEKIVLGKRPPLIQGMYCEVEISGKPKPGRVVLPRSSWHDGWVYTVDAENRLRIKDVEIDFTQENLMVVSDGIVSGATVVVSPLSPAVEGMLLKTETDKEMLQTVLQSAHSNTDNEDL